MGNKCQLLNFWEDFVSGCLYIQIGVACLFKQTILWSLEANLGLEF